jgi:hypothetical protein
VAAAGLERQRERRQRPAQLVLGTGNKLEPPPQPDHHEPERACD